MTTETITIVESDEELELRALASVASLQPAHGIWIASIDNETTGLDRRIRLPWEVGLILRSPWGDEHVWSWMLSDFSPSDPGVNLDSLKIGGFDERHPKGVYYRGELPKECHYTDGETIAKEFATALTLVPRGERVYWLGAVPDFDEQDIYDMLDMFGLIDFDGSTRWHYHLIDVENYAAGALRIPPPWDFDALLAEFGLVFPEAERHTALGDARMNLRLFDAVLTR